MTLKYGLNIVFYMKTYAQFITDDDSYYEFDFNDLNFKLTKLNKVDGSYSLIIKPIEGMEHAKDILNKIKLALAFFVLDYNWSAIEIDEKIRTANMLDSPKFIEDDFLISGDFNIDQTTLFPLVSDLVHFKSNPILIINQLSEDKLINSINKAFSKDYNRINNDGKLSLALEIYSSHSQFSRKRQFLDLITILEILKPEYSVSKDSEITIESIKTYIGNLRKDFAKSSEEYMEFDRYFGDIGYWHSKSINKSLQQFAKEYENDFSEFENIDAKVKKAYSIRSDMVHNGGIDDEFDDYHDFLKEFVGKLLKIMIFY